MSRVRVVAPSSIARIKTAHITLLCVRYTPAVTNSAVWTRIRVDT